MLVVDDDGLVLMNSVLMLEDLGHCAIDAQSGEDALNVLADGPLPDVVLTDQAMPHMTGAELAKKITERYPGLKKSSSATGYAELPEGVGADLPRLSKPFTQSQLNNLLAALEYASGAERNQ